jgi:O-antigen ligase
LSWALAALTACAGIAGAAGVGSNAAVIASFAIPLTALLLLRPEWLPPLLVVTVFTEQQGVHNIHISRVVAPIAAVALVVYVARQRALPRFPSRWVLIAVGAYAAWALVSLLWTEHVGSMFTRDGGTAYALASLALAILYMLACATLIERWQDVRRMLIAVWLSAAVVGAIAIGQYLAGERSAGLNVGPNYFAAAQVIALPLGVMLATTTEDRRWRTVLLAGVAVIGFSIFAAASRGGLIALACVLILLAIQKAPTFFSSVRFKRDFLVTAVVCGAVLFPITWYGVGNGVFGSGPSAGGLSGHVESTGAGGSGRTYLWHAAFRGWEDRPIEGLGYGAFTPEANRLLLRTHVNLNSYRLRPHGQPVHNAYLESLAELGAVGLLLFAGVLGTMYATLRRVGAEADHANDRLLATLSRALIISIAGYVLAAMFLSIETYRVLWILLGLTLALPRLTREARPTADAAGTADR